MTKFKSDEKWLREAVTIEDKANCDIHAGLELGSNLSKYIRLKQTKNINKSINKSSDD